MNCMAMVGSSMVITGSGDGFSTSVIVSPMLMPSTPATATMSPSSVAVMSVRFSPANENSLVILVVLHRAVALGDGHIFARAQRAVEDARDGQPSEVVAVVEVRHQHLQRPVGVARRMRNRLDDRFEQRLQILARLVDIGGRRAQLRVGVQHRKIELVFAGIEIDEQVVDLVQHFLRARIRTVDLVDDQDRRQLGFQRLAQHVARLRQRAFAASTSSITPSTILSARSTSPPKSLWPGVSTMLILMS